MHQGFLEAPAHNLDQQHNSFNNSGHVLQLLKPETPTFLLLFSKYFCSSKMHSYIFKNQYPVTVPQSRVRRPTASLTCVCQVVSFLSNSLFAHVAPHLLFFSKLCVCAKSFLFCPTPHLFFSHLLTCVCAKSFLFVLISFFLIWKVSHSLFSMHFSLF